MQMLPDFEEFCKQRRLERLRAELGADVCLMLDGERPRLSLLDYLPQQPITLKSGYTTQPGTTTMIDQVEIVQDAS